MTPRFHALFQLSNNLEKIFCCFLAKLGDVYTANALDKSCATDVGIESAEVEAPPKFYPRSNPKMSSLLKDVLFNP